MTELDHELAGNELYLLHRCGYSPEDLRDGKLVLFAHAAGGGAMQCDPYGWGDRTYTVAHQYVTDQFDNLIEGAVIDVEFLLGETIAPKQSERFNEIVRDIESGGDPV